MAKEDEKQMEKRKHERKPTKAPVEIVTGGSLNKETARDISINGIFIKNDDFDKYEEGQEIVLAFESRSGEPHTLEGKIVRKDKEGIGVKFKKELVIIGIKHAEEWK